MGSIGLGKKELMIKAKQSLYRRLRLPDFETIGRGRW